MPGQIVVFRQDGLGARLRNIVVGMRMQRLFGCDLIILWPLSRNTKDLRRPQRLFGAEFVANHLVLDADRIDSINAAATDLGTFEQLEQMQHHLQTGGSIRIENMGENIALPSESEEQARADFIATAATLPLDDTIQDRLARVDQFAGQTPLTAIHVRRGDIIFDPYWARRFWPSKYVPDEYYDVMIEQAPNAPYLMFSDTPESLRRFQDRYGITSAGALMGLDQVFPGQADLCELLAIARCKRVISGSYSAFSTAATLIGGAQKVALPDDMPAPLRQEAEARLQQRIQAGPEQFINQNDFAQSLHWRVQTLRAQNQEDLVQPMLDSAVQQKVWLPHLAGPILTQAVQTQQDQRVLSLIETDQKNRPFLTGYLRKPPETRRRSNQLFLAAQAFVGQSQVRQAVQTLSTLILMQHRPGPADTLSVSLASPLTTGAFDCPPTTLITYDADQGAPMGFQNIPELRTPLLQRFLGQNPALNWQAAMAADWSDLSMSGGFAPPLKALERIVATASDASVMERSLAAVGHHLAGRLPRAKRIMAAIAEETDGLTPLQLALLEKRKAQILLARSKPKAAEAAMQRAFEHSDHPAFRAWWAVQLCRANRAADAGALLRAQPPRTQYERFLLLNLPDAAEARDASGALTQSALGQSFQDGFNIASDPQQQTQAA